MNRCIPALTIALVVAIGGCESQKKAPAMKPADIGFLSTYANLQKVDADTWRYIDPNDRLARYTQFIIFPVELELSDEAKGMKTPYGELRKAQQALRQAVINAIQPPYQVVDTPGGMVAEVRIAITDGYVDGGRVGIAMQAEVLDSVSQLQLGALVEGRVGKNLAINEYWTYRDAQTIMNDWAKRFRETLDAAKKAGEGGT